MDPLTLFAAALAAGVVGASADSGRDRREAVLRIRRIPYGYTTSPWPFVQKYSISSDDPRDDDGLWHVTTGLRAVLAEGLKARTETNAVGLGGGPLHVSPETISVVPRHEAALRIYRMMRSALAAARGELSTASMLRTFVEENDGAFSEVKAWEDFLAEGGDLGDDDGIGFQLADRLGLDGPLEDIDFRDPWVQADLDRRFPTGQSRYELLQQLEVDLVEAVEGAEKNAEEKSTCLPVGFTAPWIRFSKIDPNDVAIVQVAALRSDEPVDVVPGETELRFFPESLYVVGFERP